MQKTKIDWADMTWNPVTGCLHGCEYCYARKIANRFGMPQPDNGCYVYTGKVKSYEDAVRTGPYPWGFAPTLHTYRLTDPRKIKKPQTIFVCSMADLFGDWVPDSWISTVFRACEVAPQHWYLFLTKNPSRYGRLEIENNEFTRKNIWFGATATSQDQYDKASLHLQDSRIERIFTFISIEPISEAINLHNIEYAANWIIVGAETGNRKGKITPEKSWVDDIAEQCRSVKVPIFMKESLRELMGDDFQQEFPREGNT